MHEFAYSKQIFKMVEAIAIRNNASRVTDVYIDLGSLKGAFTDWIQRYFNYISNGTIVEGAEVHINSIPGRIRCTGCGNVMEVKMYEYPETCDKCGAGDLQMISGTEFAVTSISIESDTDGDDSDI